MRGPRVFVKVIFDDLLMLAELLFDFLQRGIDRRMKIAGGSFPEIIHVVANEAAMGDLVQILDTEVPGHGNTSIEVLLQLL